jgi:hypothetical protein
VPSREEVTHPLTDVPIDLPIRGRGRPVDDATQARFEPEFLGNDLAVPRREHDVGSGLAIPVLRGAGQPQDDLLLARSNLSRCRIHLRGEPSRAVGQLELRFAQAQQVGKPGFRPR